MKRFPLVVITAALFLGLLMVVSVGVGPVTIPLGTVAEQAFATSGSDTDPQAIIIRELRIPRILLVVLVGATLGMAGTVFQGLFRNPLADPFVIGASGGAALGAVVAIVLDLGRAGGGSLTWLAFAGALSAVAVVYALGGFGRHASSVTLILAGAAVSTVFGAAVSFLMLLDEQSLQVIFTWLMGGFAGRGWPQLASSWPLMAFGIGWMMLCARPLDALTLGEDAAAGLGLPLARARILIVVGASLATAAAVSVAGIIGFVGLIAPHAARLLVGAAHRRVLIASALLGAMLLLVADNLARTFLAPVEVPVGILTAFLGGPFFLLLLRRHHQRVGFG